MRKNYKQGGSKKVFKIKKKMKKNFHEWKIIPFDLLNKYLGKNLNFHSNLLVKSSLIQNFPFYYQEIFCNWYKNLSSPVFVTSTIMSQFLWFNKCILIEKQGFLFPTISNNCLNYVGIIMEKLKIGKLSSYKIIFTFLGCN